MPTPSHPERAPTVPDPLGGLFGGKSQVAAGSFRLDDLRVQGTQAQAALDRFLASARRRARALALAQVLLLSLAGAAVSILAAGFAGSFGGAFVARTLLAVFVLGILVGLAALIRRSPLQRAAIPLRDPRSLAALLGGPSDLLSSVELSRDSPKGASGDLLALLHLRAAKQARGIDPRRALPLSSLRRAALVLAAGGLLCLLCARVAPRRLALGLSRLVGGEQAIPPAELSPIAGDLSITYLYPPYTQLAPRVEEGTAGDLHGPRGTEVRLSARADRDLERAFAVVNGAKLQLEAKGKGHRALEGSFTLRTSGEWRLRYADGRGRTIAEGPARPLQVEPDQPPQVAIEEPKKVELEVDPRGRVVLSWSATDDYGLQSVSLVFQRAGEKEQRVDLTPREAAGGASRRLRGTTSWDLAPLGLREGDKVTYAVEARDNDAIDGPQRGVSRTQVLKVFSAAEHHREALLRVQALWEKLVALLADRLEEKPPPGGQQEAGGWYGQTSQRDRSALELAADLGKTGRELLKDRLAPRVVALALRYVQSSLGTLVQRTSVARAPLGRGSAGREGQKRALDRALQNEIREEEKDVLYLADLLDRARLEDLQQLGRELSRSRRELGRLAEELRKAPDGAAKQELLAEVQRVRERVQELMARMAEMAKGIRDEHLNSEAVAAVEKERDLLSQLSDIQRKLQGGQVDEALKQLDRLASQLEQIEKGLQKSADARASGQYAEEGRKLREAAAELQQLSRREKALEERTARLRRESQQEARRAFDAKGGKELTRRLQEKVAQARKAVQQIDPQIAAQLGLEDALEAAQGRVTDLSRALSAGDFDEALDQAQRGLRALDSLQGRLSLEEQIGKRSPGFLRDPEGLRRALRGAAAAAPPLAEVASELREALPREGRQGFSSEQRKELARQRAEQRDIGEGMRALREKLAEVGRKVPIFGPSHEQLLQQAQDGMSQAEERLGRGEPRGAQAGEEQALEKLQGFEQAMQQMAKQGKGASGAGMPLPWGDLQSGDSGQEGNDDGAVSEERVQIPDAESSRGPQEFRKELLDAMKQKAPERYRERVKQYYEELVK